VSGWGGEGGRSGKGGMGGGARIWVCYMCGNSVMDGRRFVRAAMAMLAISAFSAFSAPSALAQTDPRLIEVIRHAQEGQSDSARIQVQRLLAATSPRDTLYPQIVYTQAMVASDAGTMRRQLQRVAVEYSSSSWADDALLRLVQLDYASANLDGAARNLERIRLDYPGSSLMPQAAYWAARTYFDQKKPDLACRWIADGMAEAKGNIELENQLGYLNQRCSRVAATGRLPADSQAGMRVSPDSQVSTANAPADTSRPSVQRIDTVRLQGAVPRIPDANQPARQPDTAGAAPPTRPGPAARPVARYRVQIAAVRTAAAAQATATQLKSRGFEPVTVEEGGFFKVRVGDYPTKAAAAAAVPGIRGKLGGSPFVVAEP
jgi:cell division septation protein DedD